MMEHQTKSLRLGRLKIRRIDLLLDITLIADFENRSPLNLSLSNAEISSLPYHHYYPIPFDLFHILNQMRDPIVFRPIILAAHT